MSENPELVLLYSAKNRAKTQNIPFSVSQEDIIIPEKCPVLGIKLERGTGKLHDASPTLDRIVPELGYIPDNIQVISYKANRMKSNSSVEELRMFAKWVIEEFGLDN